VPRHQDNPAKPAGDKLELDKDEPVVGSDEASSNGRTADFESAYEGSNPSASTSFSSRSANMRAEVKTQPMPTKATLVILGTISKEMIHDVVEGIRNTYGFGVKMAPMQQQPQYAFNKDRKQYYSTAILRRLAQLQPDSEDPVFGLTDADLFVPDADFVFGEADRSGMSAVVSIARLQEGFNGRPADAAKVRKRVQTEVTHELGHLLGLSHCDDSKCIMFLGETVRDVDKKGPGLCASCKAAVGLAG
jgi:archaemetzincin